MAPYVYIIIGVAVVVAGVVAGAGLYLRRRLVHEWQVAPPRLIVSFVGALACEIGFFAGAILLAVFGAGAGEDPGARRTGLLVALMAGVCYLELGAPIGAMVRGNPFHKIERTHDAFGGVKYWLKKSSRHGYRMGIFFASFLPVLAGLRLQAPGVPGWLSPILAFAWVASVVWILRGRSLFPGQQPLVAIAAAATSMFSAYLARDHFVQSYSLLVLVIAVVALVLCHPQLLPIQTWAFSGYSLAVLTLLNSSRLAGLLLVVLTGLAAGMATLARRRKVPPDEVEQWQRKRRRALSGQIRSGGGPLTG